MRGTFQKNNIAAQADSTPHYATLESSLTLREHMAMIVAQTYSSPNQREGSENQNVWNRLEDLTKLSNMNLINTPEYEARKRQLVDELTGTQVRDEHRHNKPAEYEDEIPAGSVPPLRDATKRKISVAAGTRTIEHNKINGVQVDTKGGPFPDFSRIPVQKARLLKFILEEGKFDKDGEIIDVQIDPCPFARGNLRLAHHMLACLSKRDKRLGRPQHYVAKISIDPFEDPRSYLEDVATQRCAREYAKMYNIYKPPKKVKFVEAYVISLMNRPRAPLCAVEPYIDGTYKKHNNNWGFINNKDERNTPHAFSHFTYEASRHQLLICDIQGVGDIYTDPQIHSVNGEGFGKGNMGRRGFKKFFSTHRCNSICKFLKLPLINPKEAHQELLMTMPQKELMDGDQVENVKLSFSGNLSALPPLPAFKHQNSKKQPLLGHKKDGELTTCCRCAVL
ncbi:hypothetical protein AAMO2058_000629100 [Amorphochlora amoebiformis]